MAYDPLSYYQQLTRNSLLSPAQPDRQPRFPPLKEEEERSLLSEYGSSFLGGLGYVGGLLDKLTAGRAVRGLLAGKPRELLSIIPGSDISGLTDEADVTWGKDLLEKAGFLEQGSSGFWPTVAGIGADIALSPATYLSFGTSALTPAGKLASKIGALPKTVRGRIQGLPGLTPLEAQSAQSVGINAADIIGQPLGGVARFKIPFVSSSETVLGAGPSGEKFLDAANAAYQTVGHGAYSPLKYVTPTVEGAYDYAARLGRGLFQGKYLGQLGKDSQIVAPEVYAARDIAQRDLSKPAGEFIMELKQAGITNDFAKKAIENPTTVTGPLADQARTAYQRLLDAEEVYRQRAVAAGLDAPTFGPIDPATKAGQRLGYVEREALNLKTGEVQGYLRRYGIEPEPATIRQALLHSPASRAPEFQLHPPTTAGREDFLRGIDSETFNALTRGQPDLFRPLGQPGTLKLHQRADQIREAVNLPITTQRSAIINQVRNTRQNQDAYEALAEMTPQQAAQHTGLSVADATVQIDQAKGYLLNMARYDAGNAIAKRLATMNPSYAGKDFFGRHLADDWLEGAKGHAVRATGAEGVTEMLARGLSPLGAPGTEFFLPANRETLKGLGFQYNRLGDVLDNLKNTAQSLGKPVGNLTDWALDPNTLKEVTAAQTSFQLPQAIQPVATVLDWFTNAFKALNTSPWWGYLIRNKVSGTLAHVSAGANDPRYTGLAKAQGYLRPINDGWDLVKGKYVDDLTELPVFQGRNLTAQQASEEVMIRAAAERVTGQGHYGMENVLGGPVQSEFSKKIPGLEPYEGTVTNILNQFRGLIGNDRLRSAVAGPSVAGYDPRALRGVGGLRETKFAPVLYGEKIGAATDDAVRLGTFIGKLRQGYTFREAADIARAAHGDYSYLSGFERSLRHFIPFYSWTRAMLPEVTGQMLRNPGGLYGTSARAAASVRGDQDQFVPERLGGGLAIPVGEQEEGIQRYLARLDINPAEAVFEWLKPSPTQTGLSVLGQTTPWLKYPLEQLSGKEFFTGRDLADVPAKLTPDTQLDRLLGNIPWTARLASTLGQIMEPRNRQDVYTLPVNLLTGMRLSDVDLERSKDAALRKLQEEELRGQDPVRFFSRPYVRPEDLAQLTPQQIALLQLGATLEKRAKERSKKIGVGR